MILYYFILPMNYKIPIILFVLYLYLYIQPYTFLQCHVKSHICLFFDYFKYIQENKWHVIPFQITFYGIYLNLHHRFLIHTSDVTSNMQYASIWLRSLTMYEAEIFILVQIPISSKTFINTHTQCITASPCALKRQIISITAVHCKDVQVSYKLTLSQYISRCT